MNNKLAALVATAVVFIVVFAVVFVLYLPAGLEVKGINGVSAKTSWLIATGMVTFLLLGLLNGICALVNLYTYFLKELDKRHEQ